MKSLRWKWMFLLVLTSAVSAQQPAHDPTPSVIVIRAGTLIDGKSDKPRHDQLIIIRGNHIESVADAASAKIPPGATTIDLSKRWKRSSS